jgi:hypothetical protein
MGKVKALTKMNEQRDAEEENDHRDPEMAVGENAE